MELRMQCTEEELNKYFTDNNLWKKDVSIHGTPVDLMLCGALWHLSFQELFECTGSNGSKNYTIFYLTPQSKEVKAAEESVAKAKEALKAAENTLKAVKEKK